MQTFTDIIMHIYEPSYKGKTSVWSKRLFVFIFVFITFHVINHQQILKPNLLNLTEVLYLLYVILLAILSKYKKASMRIQFFKLWMDLAFILVFEYFSLKLIGIHSWVYVLLLIPILYSSFWFKKRFSYFITSMISASYLIMNFLLINFKTSRIDQYEILSILASTVLIFYLVTFISIFLKEKIQSERKYDLEMEKGLVKYLYDYKIVINLFGFLPLLKKSNDFFQYYFF